MFDSQEAAYYKLPKLCKCCSTPLPYHKRQHTFCSHSCSALFNNAPRQGESRYCNQCGEKLIGKSKEWCSNSCRLLFRKEATIKQWKMGVVQGWSGKTRGLCTWLRRYLHETRGTSCEVCGWDGRHPVDNAVLTEIDHIDGDAENCCENNLRILCPNCHASTPTHRARNKNSKRNRSAAI